MGREPAGLHRHKPLPRADPRAQKHYVVPAITCITWQKFQVAQRVLLGACRGAFLLHKLTMSVRLLQGRKGNLRVIML